MKEISPLHALAYAQMYGKAEGFDPDYRFRIEQERRGAYANFVVTDEDRIVGVLAFFLKHSSHTKQPFALEDVWCIAPAYRKGRVANRMLTEAEKHLNAHGVFDIRFDLYAHARRIQKLIVRAGYAPHSIVYRKTGSAT